MYFCIMIQFPANERDKYIDKYEEPSHHIDTLLRASIITLDIRPRMLYPLWDAGIRTVADLLCLYREGLKRIHSIGIRAEVEIEGILTKADLINIEPI